MEIRKSYSKSKPLDFGHKQRCVVLNLGLRCTVKYNKLLKDKISEYNGFFSSNACCKNAVFELESVVSYLFTTYIYRSVY